MELCLKPHHRLHLGLQPGEYIRFISEITHTKRFENGIVTEDGLIQSIGRYKFKWKINLLLETRN